MAAAPWAKKCSMRGSSGWGCADFMDVLIVAGWVVEIFTVPDASDEIRIARTDILQRVLILEGAEMAQNQQLFEKMIVYKELTSKQKELFNFQKLAATLADHGFNCIKLADDWQGADFLAYPMIGDKTLKVQLKSRLTIAKKYENKEIWIAFPYSARGNSEKHWYLIEHDCLREKIGRYTKWLSSKEWSGKGIYHSTSINPELLANLEENKLGPVYGPVLPLAED
jgi:hypothetical protein